MRTSLLLIIGITVFLNACKKANTSTPELPAEPAALFACHESTNLDSTATINRLTGTWKLVKLSVYIQGDVPIEKPVTLTFNANGNYELKENGVIKEQGTWTLVRFSEKYFRMLVSGSYYADGGVVLCGNQLYLENKPVDGADKWYQKIN